MRAALAATAVLVLAACAGQDPPPLPPPTTVDGATVETTACRTEGDHGVWEGTITLTRPEPADVLVFVDFTDEAGVVVNQALASGDGMTAGQTVTVVEPGVSDGAEMPEQVGCRVTMVQLVP